MISTIHLLGDSTLDNLWWLLNEEGSNLEDAKANCVAGKLQAKLGSQFTVINHAYDGFTTKDVLGVGNREIGDIFVSDAQIRNELRKTWPKYRAYMNERAPDAPSVKPLEALEKSLPPDGHHYVVVSVGGNDFREYLTNPWRLIRSISYVQHHYLQIVERVKALSTEKRGVHPLFMFQYQIDANNDVHRIYKLLGGIGSLVFSINVICFALILMPLFHLFWGIYPLIGLLGLYLSHKVIPLSVSKDILQLKKPSISLFGALLKRLYQPMLQEARESRIPILDLPNTFNPYRHLYISGIEPNAEGAELIAEGIAHIVQNHDFDGESQLYAAKDAGYVGSPNTHGWSVAYPQP